MLSIESSVKETKVVIPARARLTAIIGDIKRIIKSTRSMKIAQSLSNCQVTKTCTSYSLYSLGGRLVS